MFSLICVWINGWVNNREAGDLRRYRAHYDLIVMYNQLVRRNMIYSLMITSGHGEIHSVSTRIELEFYTKTNEWTLAIVRKIIYVLRLFFPFNYILLFVHIVWLFWHEPLKYVGSSHIGAGWRIYASVNRVSIGSSHGPIVLISQFPVLFSEWASAVRDVITMDTCGMYIFFCLVLSYRPCCFWLAITGILNSTFQCTLIFVRFQSVLFHHNKSTQINSLWPSDAIWWHKNRSTLTQVMACRHQAITWTNVDLSSIRSCENSPGDNCTSDTSVINH